MLYDAESSSVGLTGEGDGKSGTRRSEHKLTIDSHVLSSVCRQFSLLWQIVNFCKENKWRLRSGNSEVSLLTVFRFSGTNL